MIEFERRYLRLLEVLREVALDPIDNVRGPIAKHDLDARLHFQCGVQHLLEERGML
jgi:hypothetical protein